MDINSLEIKNKTNYDLIYVVLMILIQIHLK